MELASTKITVLTLLGALRLLFGLAPLRLARSPSLRVERVISLCLCCGGGVLLATSLMHMLPEVRESLDAVRESGRLLPSPSSFPLAELLLCIGFFLVYVLEEVVHAMLARDVPRPSEKPQICCSTVQAEIQQKSQHLGVDKFALNGEPEVTIAPSWSRPKSNGKIAPATSQVHLLASTLSLDHREKELPSDHTVVGQLRGALVVVALSFHSVFEGLAIGLQQTGRDVWYLFAAVSIHAVAIMFCVGLELAVARLRPFTVVLYVVLLALMSPFGVAVGVVVTAHAPGDSAMQALVVAVLQGLAGGTLLYVTFFEVLNREKNRDDGGGILRISFILIGFAAMVILQTFGEHDHDGGKEHVILPQNATLEDVHRHEHGFESR